jgi:hypothetical protein
LCFCTFSFGHCVVCSSSKYGFWLPLWYLQTLLLTIIFSYVAVISYYFSMYRTNAFFRGTLKLSIKLLFGTVKKCEHELRTKTGWLGIGIMWTNEAACFLVDCCFSEQHYDNLSSHHLDLVTKAICSRHDITEKVVKQQLLTHSLNLSDLVSINIQFMFTFHPRCLKGFVLLDL